MVALAEKQNGCECSDGNANLVGELQALAAFPGLFGHNDSKVITKAGLLGVVQAAVKYHMLLEDRSPGLGEGLGEQLLTAALS
jgi:hypothetical protein